MNNWWYWHKPNIPAKSFPLLLGMAAGLTVVILWALGVLR